MMNSVDVIVEIPDQDVILVPMDQILSPQGRGGMGGTVGSSHSSHSQFLEKMKMFGEMPLCKQKSQQWLNQRYNYLTASTIAHALGISGSSARNALLVDKVSYGQVNGFHGNVFTQWGTKYEPVANRIYSYRHDQIKIYDFGVITNPKYPILGISPDGITEPCMIEIKCPYSRVINGKIKTEYYHQMQDQMAVCEFDSCDFLECGFIEIPEAIFWDDFNLDDSKENLNRERGIVITYINLVEKEIEYLYSPIEYCTDLAQMKQWEQDTIKGTQPPERLFLAETYWRLKTYSCQLVKRDPTWIKVSYPKLLEFWAEVEYYRKVGIEALLKKIEDSKHPSDDEEDDLIYRPRSKGRGWMGDGESTKGSIDQFCRPKGTGGGGALRPRSPPAPPSLSGRGRGGMGGTYGSPQVKSRCLL